MEVRTLRGIMGEKRVSVCQLANEIHMGRATLTKKINCGNWNANEIRAICSFFGIKDAELICDIFSLREPLQYCDDAG